MSGAYVLAALIAFTMFSALVLMQDRRRGGLIGQLGTGIGAIILFVAYTFDQRPEPVPAPVPGLMAGGVGILSAATGGMGYHLFLGRFTSLWAARRVFLCVSLGLAVALGAALNYLS